MKRNRWVVSAMTASLLTLLLTACGSSVDPGSYIQAKLDAAIHGDYTEYVEITGMAEDEAQKASDAVLDSLTEQIDNMGVPEEWNEKYRTLLENLLKKTSYDVQEVRDGEEKGTYTVVVAVQPLEGVFDGLMDTMNDKIDEFIQDTVSSGEIPTEDEITEWTYETIYNVLSENLDKATYGETVEVTVTVTKDKDAAGDYTISDGDIQSIARQMIDFGDLTEYAETLDIE
jgi:hypothetical protein